MKGEWLETLTWPEAEARLAAGAVVLVPIGAAAKEHGHHLPLGTDYLLARGICDRVARDAGVLIAPVISFGYYPAFRHYPGSQHLSPETFAALLREVLGGLAAQGARRIVVVNTGISTEPIVNVELREFYEATGLRVLGAHISRLGRSVEHIFAQELGGHGDEHETSLILAIAPGQVRPGKAVCDYGHARAQPKSVFYVPTVFDGDPAAGPDYTATGVRGDPTLATPEKGETALQAIADDILAGIRAHFGETGQDGAGQDETGQDGAGNDGRGHDG
jgi:creatinine amidohydrolase